MISLNVLFEFLNTYLCLAIQTAAIDNLSGKESARFCRKPEIMADAAYAIFTKDSRTFTGHFTIDEDIMRAEGLSQAQIDQYACDPC